MRRGGDEWVGSQPTRGSGERRKLPQRGSGRSPAATDLEIFFCILQGVSLACYASPVLAMIGMSVCPSVHLSDRHTLALCKNDAS